MSSRFSLPFANTGAGISPADGAKLNFFETGTSTRKTTYSDEALTTANANPVIADARGVFPDIWIPDGGRYKVTLTDRNDVQKFEADPIVGIASAKLATRRFDTVAAMVASSEVSIGDIVETTGYTTKGDGGANTYEIVAASTGMVDGGRFIDLTGISGQAKGLFVDNIVSAKQYGAVGGFTGTGGTDDSVALQAWLDKGGELYLPADNYRCDSNLTVSVNNTSVTGDSWLNSVITLFNTATHTRLLTVSADFVTFNKIGFSGNNDTYPFTATEASTNVGQDGLVKVSSGSSLVIFDTCFFGNISVGASPVPNEIAGLYSEAENVIDLRLLSCKFKSITSTDVDGVVGDPDGFASGFLVGGVLASTSANVTKFLVRDCEFENIYTTYGNATKANDGDAIRSLVTLSSGNYSDIKSCESVIRDCKFHKVSKRAIKNSGLNGLLIDGISVTSDSSFPPGNAGEEMTSAVSSRGHDNVVRNVTQLYKSFNIIEVLGEGRVSDIIYDADAILNYAFILGEFQSQIGSFYISSVNINKYSGALVASNNTTTGSELIVSDVRATNPSAQISSGYLFNVQNFSTVELHDIHNPYSGTNVTNGLNMVSVSNLRMYGLNLECDEQMANFTSDPTNLVIKDSKFRTKTIGFNNFYAEPTTAEINNCDFIVPSMVDASKSALRLDGTGADGVSITDVRIKINYTDGTNNKVPNGILLKNSDQSQLKNITMLSSRLHTDFDTTTVGVIVFLNTCNKIIVSDAGSIFANGIQTTTCTHVIGRNIIARVAGNLNPTSGSSNIDITGTLFSI